MGLSTLCSHVYTNMIILECKTNYHNNYSVCGGVRTYFGGVPDLSQIGEHQFIETALINTWVDLMLTAWWVAHSDISYLI
jgi:CxC5 like cysteine cluster associated with KDZ transposases